MLEAMLARTAPLNRIANISHQLRGPRAGGGRVQAPKPPPQCAMIMLECRLFIHVTRARNLSVPYRIEFHVVYRQCSTVRHKGCIRDQIVTG